MKTKAVRLHGVNDLRVEEFDLPALKEDEILVKIISDSVCMSTHKLAKQGEAHARVMGSLTEEPVIIGHEIAGLIVEVGSKWQERFQKGQKFTIQPSLNYKGSMITPGYSYPYFGGDCTYAIVPKEVIELDCFIPYEGDAFFSASLSEPVSCVIAGFNRNFHTNSLNHEFDMGVKKGGNLAILGACGPMGLEAIDYAIQLENGPQLIVAVDASAERITRAKRVLPPEKAVALNKQLVYLNPTEVEDVLAELLKLTDQAGYDDVFVYAPIQALIEQADQILGKDGCLNFFAGPVDKELSAKLNMYNLHYKYTHMIGFTGSTMADMHEAIDLSSRKRIDPAIMITHIGGLEAAVETTLKLPTIPGGKKLIYTQIDLPLTAIDEFQQLGEQEELFQQLHEACERHAGCWNKEAEDILLAHFEVEVTLAETGGKTHA